MAQEHEVFEIPDDRNCKIWRYMDFTKFVAMLNNKALFFSRADLLGDSFEGSFSKENVRVRPIVYKEMIKSANQAAISSILEVMKKCAEWVREWTYINCWHMNEHESAAMWKLYALSCEAIAIQSTYDRLFRCLPDDGFFVGKVKYIDYEKDVIPENNTFYPFVHKRKSFEHEREVRAVHQSLPARDGKLLVGVSNSETGRNVAVNLNDLIECIYLAPRVPLWFSKLVAETIEKYGIKRDVKSSRLDDSPVY